MLLIYKIVPKDLDRFCIFPPNVDKTYLLHFISVNLTFSIWLIQRSYLSPLDDVTHGDARRLGPACLCRRDEMGGTRDPGQVVSVLKGGAELTTEPGTEWTQGPGPAPHLPSTPACP